MTKEKTKSLLLIIIVLSLFPISYFYRRIISNDIKDHSKFTVGKIFKLTSSLKSGNAWHYQFTYNGNQYENYRSTHVDYDVNIGDYFLVNFSTINPAHSKILYDYKLNLDKANLIDQIWDTIPNSSFHSGLKTGH